MKRILFTALIAVGFFASQTSFAATTEENKNILKDALVGAMTGTAAVLGTNEDTSVASTPAKNFSIRKRHHHDDDDDYDGDHHHKHKDKKRPHGWDMGKKMGWGGKDTPPGQTK